VPETATNSMTTPSTILHIPHSATAIPPDIRQSFFLTDAELDAELLAMTDTYTAELFTTTVRSMRCVYPVSRLVVDPERFTVDEDEVLASRGMGVIYTRTSAGLVLRDPPDTADRSALLERFYFPHHAALSAATSAALHEHGGCLIIDCHSFPSAPLPYELDPESPRPDICLGTDVFHTSESLYEYASDLFIEAGYSVLCNRPFAGTIVPMQYYRRDAAVQSLMIELNRSLYMNERDGTRLPEADLLAGALTRILDALADFRGQFLGRRGV